MNVGLAVIGGVGFALAGQDDIENTPYGKVSIVKSKMNGKEIVFISRHGIRHLPPHKVNYRAIISAAKQLGAMRIISINTVGSMAGHPLGSIFLPIDFVDFTNSRENTFFEEKAVHVDMSEPYCKELRAYLAESAVSLHHLVFEGIYVCAQGPHLESPAQIRMMRQFGDVVGMTGYPEVVLAKEAELCYASLCVVTNPACGMTNDRSLSLTEISDLMKKCNESVQNIVIRTVQIIPAKRCCKCKDALLGAAL
jgi:5'-methylthioadenosine phosphorylase